MGFCVTVLGVESATRRSNDEPYQFQVLTDVVHAPRVAVRSGHGVGKSAIDAWVALWWLVTRPMSRVVLLAPEYARQIRAVLFSEARKWAQRARVKLPVEVLASRILVNGYGEEWSATGASTSGDPARLEGFHAEGGVLIIADEVKGITTEAFDAVQGALTGAENSRLLVTSVPGGAGGPFYHAVVRDAARWVVHHIPSPDSSLVSPQWVEDRRIEWGGTETALYQMRVMGNFADLEAGAMVAISTLELMDTLYAAQPVLQDEAHCVPEANKKPADDKRDAHVRRQRTVQDARRHQERRKEQEVHQLRRARILHERQAHQAPPLGAAHGTSHGLGRP